MHKIIYSRNVFIKDKIIVECVVLLWLIGSCMIVAKMPTWIQDILGSRLTQGGVLVVEGSDIYLPF